MVKSKRLNKSILIKFKHVFDRLHIDFSDPSAVKRTSLSRTLTLPYICKEYIIAVNDSWYFHNPDPVVDKPNVTIMWDTQVETNRDITANKPDIIINKKDKINLLIDLVVRPMSLKPKTEGCGKDTQI